MVRTDITGTVRRIDDLFNRGRGEWPQRDSAWDVPGLPLILAEERIRAKLWHLPCALVAKAYRPEQHTRAESATHKALKAAAVAWMRSQGADDAWPERDAPGGRADAYSVKAAWVVEVGNTPLWKLAEVLRGPADPDGRGEHRFTLIPFQSIQQRDGSMRGACCIDFSCDLDTAAALYAAHEENRLKLVRGATELLMRGAARRKEACA